jgi:outer membrane receptor protein involved in Fe transport
MGNSGFFRTEIHLLPYPETETGRLMLFPALRYDADLLEYPDEDIRNFNHKWSFNTGIMVPFDSERKTVLKGNIGTSFRVPSFDDLFWPSTAFAVGNPNLLPEEALIYDVGLLFKPYHFFSYEIVFYNHIVTNLIQWNPGATGQWTPVNIGSAKISGIETEASFIFELSPINSVMEITGNYTHLIALDTTEGSSTYGKQLPRRAREQTNAAVTLQHMQGHSLHVEGRYVGFRYQTAQNTKYLPSYFVLNATARIRFLEHFTISLNGRNLLDKEYIDIREFPVPGRELGCSIEFQY